MAALACAKSAYTGIPRGLFKSVFGSASRSRVCGPLPVLTSTGWQPYRCAHCRSFRLSPTKCAPAALTFKSCSMASNNPVAGFRQLHCASGKWGAVENTGNPAPALLNELVQFTMNSLHLVEAEIASCKPRLIGGDDNGAPRPREFGYSFDASRNGYPLLQIANIGIGVPIDYTVSVQDD